MMIYILILLAVLAVDLTIKNHIEHKYPGNRKKDVAWGCITIRNSKNTGGFLNFMDKKSFLVKVFSGVLIIGCIIYLIYLIVKNEGAIKKLALALILGGALSNEYDRIKKGSVTDYFSINLPFMRNIVFNLGDMSIFAGIILLICDD
ncbi:MAG: signal peptidase II [Lachnospiraceae bacterium]|nr:signal peptidase II [Lachnospiraceae bacterium]